MSQPDKCPLCGDPAEEREKNSWVCGTSVYATGEFNEIGQRCQITCLTRERDALAAKLAKIELEIHSGADAETIRLNIHRILHPLAIINRK